MSTVFHEEQTFHEVRWMQRYKKDENEIRVITAKFHLHKIGNQSPYFSLTANIKYWDGGEAGGCYHKEIAHHFPELAQFVPLHLSDEHGCPMHAVANGAYHLGCGKYGKRNSRILQSHLRTTEAETAVLLKRCYACDGTKTGEYFVQKLVTKTLAKRWESEAKAAIEWMKKHSND